MTILTPRHQPKQTLKGHLEFALEYGGVDFCVLKESFEEIVAIIREPMANSYARRI